LNLAQKEKEREKERKNDTEEESFDWFLITSSSLNCFLDLTYFENPIKNNN
jgi:hypothetical protein